MILSVHGKTSDKEFSARRLNISTTQPPTAPFETFQTVVVTVILTNELMLISPFVILWSTT